MLRTTEGKLIDQMIKEFRNEEKLDAMNAHASFNIDGGTSECFGYEGMIINVECDVMFIILRYEDYEIKIPNYGHVNSLIECVKKAAEVVFFSGKCRSTIYE